MFESVALGEGESPVDDKPGGGDWVEVAMKWFDGVFGQGSQLAVIAGRIVVPGRAPFYGSRAS